jgi:multimeric flavodoxin WrbA
MAIRLRPPAWEALDKLDVHWATALRTVRRERIMAMLELVMAKAGREEAGLEDVIAAARLALPPTMEVFINRLRPGAGRPPASSTTLEEYLRKPRVVKRWPTTYPASSRPAAEMDVLAISASPRLNGNTEALLDEALAGMREAGVRGEKVRLQKMEIKHCISCRQCKQPGAGPECAIRDDLTPLLPKVIGCDALLYAFPVYTGRECAQLATFLDRLDCFWGAGLVEKTPPGRTALAIATWGYPSDKAYDHVLEYIINLFRMHNIDTVEAISAGGFAGPPLFDLDQEGRAIIRRYPAELRKVREAGRALVTGRAVG